MAMELELRLYSIMSDMMLQMAGDLTDEQMAQPLGQGNCPSWIVGHLAIVNDFGVATLGGAPELLGDYLPMFGPGSPPTGDHPPKSELVEMFKMSRSRFVAVVESATKEQLAAQRDSELLKESFPLVSDMVGHLLTTHLSLHTGQLSAWRRYHGMDSILKL